MGEEINARGPGARAGALRCPLAWRAGKKTDECRARARCVRGHGSPCGLRPMLWPIDQGLVRSPGVERKGGGRSSPLHPARTPRRAAVPREEGKKTAGFSPLPSQTCSHAPCPLLPLHHSIPVLRQVLRPGGRRRPRLPAPRHGHRHPAVRRDDEARARRRGGGGARERGACAWRERERAPQYPHHSFTHAHALHSIPTAPSSCSWSTWTTRPPSSTASSCTTARPR